MMLNPGFPTDDTALRRTASGLYVPRRRYRRPIGIDLFAGAGGMSLGCHQAGFHMIAAVEIDYSAAVTYLVNLAKPGVKLYFDTEERKRGFNRVVARAMGIEIDRDGYIKPGQDLRRIETFAGSGWISHYGEPWRPEDYPNEYIAETNKPPVHPDGCEHFWVADVRNLRGQDILDALGLEQGDVDLVCGGPPCQGFSRANTERSVMDPRNSLVFDFARLVLEIRPKAVMMENVPGILDMVTPEGIPVMDAFCRVLEDGGFGSYDALRRSLLASSGVGAAVRTRRKRDTSVESPSGNEEQQLSLFGGMTA